MIRPSFRLALLASSLLLTAACGDEEETTDTGASDTMEDMGGSDMGESDMGMEDMAMGDMGTDMGGIDAIEGTAGSSSDGTFFVTLDVPDEPPTVGNSFAIVVNVFEPDETTHVADAELTLTESMPMMGHGMDSEPTITANGDGTFDVGNLEYSMEGLWHFNFTITSGERSDSIVFATTCCE